MRDLRIDPWKLPIGRTGENLAASRRKRFLDEITVVQREKPLRKPNQKPEISKNATRVLMHEVLTPGHTLGDIADALGLQPSQMSKVVSELRGLGIAQDHKLPRLGRGAQPKVLKILDEADRILSAMGLERSKPRLKGGFRHDLFGRYFESWLRARRCSDIRFEKTFGEKTFDLAYRLPPGGLGAGEICLSGSAGRTAEQLSRGLKCAGLKELVAVFERRGQADGVRKALGSQAGDHPEERLRFLLVGEILASFSPVNATQNQAGGSRRQSA